MSGSVSQVFATSIIKVNSNSPNNLENRFSLNNDKLTYISHQTTWDSRHLFHSRRCWQPKYHPAFPLYDAQIFPNFVLSNSTKQSSDLQRGTCSDTAQSFPAFMKTSYLSSLTNPTGCFFPILCYSESSKTRRHESEWGCCVKETDKFPLPYSQKPAIGAYPVPEWSVSQPLIPFLQDSS